MVDVLYDWGGLNTWLFKVINGIGGPAYGKVMLWIGNLGAPEHFRYWFAFVLVYCLAEMLAGKIRGQPLTSGKIRVMLALCITLVMGYAAYGFMVGIFKAMVALPRPFMLPGIRAGMHFYGTYPDPADYYATFPSAHAATIAFIVWVLWHHLKHPYVRYVGILLIVLVCWARIAVGMHFPADVVAGAFLGLLVGHVVQQYVYRMMRVPLAGKLLPLPAAVLHFQAMKAKNQKPKQ